MAADEVVDGAQPDEPVLESAMATGSDAGEPGDRTPLPEPGEHEPGAPVEESPEATSAAVDDTVLPPSVLPPAPAAQDDPLTPEFRPPAEG